MPENFKIITADRVGLDVVINWAVDLGWNPGKNDAWCYHMADQNGFLMGYLDDRPIASISAMKYSDSFGFLGFYIVKPEHRGKGYGLQMWQAGMKYLKGCNVGLDGVIEQQDNYKKSGFKLAYNNIRYEGLGGGYIVDYPNLIELSELTFDMIAQYEEQFFPAVRLDFLDNWIAQRNSRAFAVMEDENLTGYGVIRACYNGYKIGPLYADTPALANQLFQALKSKINPDEKVYLDVPEINQAAIDLAKHNNMTESFRTARMYSKETPKLPTDKIFGVTSFEVG